MPDEAFKVESAIANDKCGAIESTMTGAHIGHMPSVPANGGRRNLCGISAFDLGDGQRIDEYLDSSVFQFAAASG